jgi:hypothetical protein
MSDTPPEIEKKFRQMMMARSAAERMVMGASMYETARAFVLASMPPGLSADELKRRLCKRIYGKEIEEVIKVVRDGPEA